VTRKRSWRCNSIRQAATLVLVAIVVVVVVASTSMNWQQNPTVGNLVFASFVASSET